MLVRTIIATVMLAFSLAGAPVAATLDFTEVSSGYQRGTVLELSNATVTSLGSDLYVYRANQSSTIGPLGGFCAIGGGCAADALIDFKGGPVAALQFTTHGWQSGDRADISIFAGNSVLSTMTIMANTLVDFTGFSGITSMLIDDTSTAAGMAYTNFSFTSASTPTAVPLPMAGWLLFAAVGGLVWVKRRRT